jgi:hypothetical protein
LASEGECSVSHGSEEVCSAWWTRSGTMPTSFPTEPLCLESSSSSLSKALKTRPVWYLAKRHC